MNQDDNSLTVFCNTSSGLREKHKRLQDEAKRKRDDNISRVLFPLLIFLVLRLVKRERPRETVLQLVKRDGCKYWYWIFSHCVQRWIYEFNDDEEFILAVKRAAEGTEHERSTFWIQGASARLQSNKSFVLQMPKSNDANLQYAAAELRDDKDFLLELIQECSVNCTVLKHASPRLQNDPQAVLAAVSKNPESFLYASDGVLGNKDFMTQAVQVNGMFLKHATKNVRDDEDVVSLAVQKNGRALEYASPRLQDNKAIVVVAVGNCGCVLGRASPRLRADFETAIAAVQNDSLAMYFVSGSLQRNLDIAANAELRNLQLPLLLKQQHNQHRQPRSLFPYFLEKANRQPIIIFYLLKNRHDLIPSKESSELASQEDTDLKKCLNLENSSTMQGSPCSEMPSGRSKIVSQPKTCHSKSCPAKNIVNRDDASICKKKNVVTCWNDALSSRLTR